MLRRRQSLPTIVALLLLTFVGTHAEERAQSFGSGSAAMTINAGVRQSARWILKEDSRNVGSKGEFLLWPRIGESDSGPTSWSASQWAVAFSRSSTGTTPGETRLSPWQQAGIYGLEFLAGEIGTGASLYYAYAIGSSGSSPHSDLPTGAAIYTAGTALLTSTCTYLTGRLLKQEGRWWRAAVGAGVGSLIGVSSTYLMLSLSRGHTSDLMVVTTALLVLPALGATIGFNLN